MSVCLSLCLLVSKRYDGYSKGIFYIPPLYVGTHDIYADKIVVFYIFPCGGRCAPPTPPSEPCLSSFTSLTRYWVDIWVWNIHLYGMGWGAPTRIYFFIFTKVSIDVEVILI